MRTLLTDEVRAAVERELASGVPIAVAAQRLGLGRRTLHSWLADGRIVRRAAASPEPDPVPVDDASIRDRLDRAEPALVGIVLDAARRGSWQASSWLLERTWPERWARPPARTATEPAAGSDVFDEIDAFRRRRRGLPSERE